MNFKTLDEQYQHYRGQRELLFYFTGLAVLKCPMSVEDKIATLESAIAPLIEKHGLKPYPQTGLEPFDKAMRALYDECSGKTDLVELHQS